MGKKSHLMICCCSMDSGTFQVPATTTFSKLTQGEKVAGQLVGPLLSLRMYVYVMLSLLIFYKALWIILKQNSAKIYWESCACSLFSQYTIHKFWCSNLSNWTNRSKISALSLECSIFFALFDSKLPIVQNYIVALA